MTIDDVALRAAEALNYADVPFILVGGFSSNYYGDRVSFCPCMKPAWFNRTSVVLANYSE